MDVFVFVIWVVIIVVAGRTISAYFRLKEKSKRERQSEEEVNAEHLERLARLEERIEVLERIVTDERYELRQRFRNL